MLSDLHVYLLCNFHYTTGFYSFLSNHISCLNSLGRGYVKHAYNYRGWVGVVVSNSDTLGYVENRYICLFVSTSSYRRTYVSAWFKLVSLKCMGWNPFVCVCLCVWICLYTCYYARSNDSFLPTFLGPTR